MSEFKKIFKTIEAGLPNKTRIMGVDITNLVDPNLLNKLAGDELSVGLGTDATADKLKPIANLAVKKGPVQGAITGAAKDDFGAGLGYLFDDNSGSASLSFSKTPQGGSSMMLRGTKSFKKGGLLKQGKPKLALRGWK
jgi:hypothetical protein